MRALSFMLLVLSFTIAKADVLVEKYYYIDKPSRHHNHYEHNHYDGREFKTCDRNYYEERYKNYNRYDYRDRHHRDNYENRYSGNGLKIFANDRVFEVGINLR